MITTVHQRWGRAVKAAALAVVGAVTLSLAACTSGGSGEAGAPSDTLTVAVSTPPISMDPTTAGNGLPLAWYMALPYEPLIQRAPDGTTSPGLATEWAYSEDRLSFVMQLREGVTFSDGDELTAEGVVAWLDHYKANGTFSGNWFANVTGFEATGPLEVTVRLSSPDPMLPWAFGQAGNAGAIVSPTGLANLESLGTETHGAGPYLLDSEATVANSSYVFVKNPNYWDPDSQHYEKIVFTVIADQNSTLSALRSGQVQVAQGSSATAEAAREAGLEVFQGPSAMVGAYFADFSGTVVPQFADVRVRQALNYALDRDAITSAVYGDFGTATVGYTPEGIVGYLPELSDVYPYDPEKARELLAEAGYPDGFSFTMLVQTGIDNGDLLAEAMVAQWAEVGVDVELKSYAAFADYVTDYFSNQYGITTLNYNYSEQLNVTSGLAIPGAAYNTFGFNDQGAIDLVTEQRRFDTDSPEGKAAAEASETYLVETAFAVPVASIDAVIFSNSSVKNVDFSVFLAQPQYWQPAG